MSDREAEEIEDYIADGSLAERILSAAFQTAVNEGLLEREKQRRTRHDEPRRLDFITAITIRQD